MRREMLQTVSRFTDVSEKVILYGDTCSNLSDTNNELVLKLSIDIFIKLKGFHLEINTFSRHNWNYCALCIEIVLFS